ncbi:MAG TPA: GyrI-like domain-containing protein [Symbiobacteriaceae bacterium]|jgi:effector-binding domain-containing protein
MYTVGQMARVCFVSTKLLRHYDEIQLFRPARVGPENQYRYYDREQVLLLRRILFLRDLGLGLEVIRELVNSGAVEDPARISAILAERAAGIAHEIAARRELLDRIERVTAMLHVKGEISMTNPTVTIKDVPALEVVGIRKTIAIRDIGNLLEEAARKLRSRPAGPPICLYHTQEFDPEAIDVEALFPVTARGNQTLPAVKVAAITHLGKYEDISQTYSVLFEWVNQHGYSLTGPTREHYIIGPESNRPPEEYVTEVQAPIG